MTVLDPEIVGGSEVTCAVKVVKLFTGRCAVTDTALALRIGASYRALEELALSSQPTLEPTAPSVIAEAAKQEYHDDDDENGFHGGVLRGLR
jgi:hypothetical protein